MAHITMSVSDKDGMTSRTFLLDDSQVERIFEALKREYKQDLVDNPTYDEVFGKLFHHLMASVVNTVFKQEINTKMLEFSTTIARIPVEAQ